MRVSSTVLQLLSRSTLLLLLLVISGTSPTPVAAQQAWTVEEPGGETTLLEYTATEGTWMSVDVSPDGDHIAFDLLGHIYEMPIEGGRATRLTDGRSWNLSPRYSPDGTRIAFSSDRDGSHDVWILRREDGSLTNVSRTEGNVQRPSWSPDGRRVVAGLVAYDLDGGSAPLVDGRHGIATFEPGGEGFYYEHRARGMFPFEFNPYVIPAGGVRIEHQRKGADEPRVHVERPGGAFNPALSPDGRSLAYLNRDVDGPDDTILILQDLATREERVLLTGLDPDKQEGGGFAGPYPNMAWHPDGDRIYVSLAGGIHSVDTETGQATRVPFQASVRRALTRTLRFTTDIPERNARTRMHRWGSRTPDGVLYEALGDLWLRDDNRVRNLTSSEAHETTPTFDRATGTLYYASWTDDDHGAVYALRPGGGEPERLTRVPGQYGSLAVSRDGRRLAYVRGTGGLERGLWLSNETRFELVVREEGGAERVVTDVSGRELQYANFAAKIPPHVSFAPDGETVYFTEFVRDTLMLKRIGLDGRNERILYRLPNAVDAVPSPDLRWVALREYHRSFLTPFEDRGEPLTISAYDGRGQTFRVDAEDGGYLTWAADGRSLGWTRGSGFYEKEVDRIVAEDERNGLTSGQQAASAREWRESRVPGSTARRTDVSMEFPIDAPETDVALTGVRVITMNPGREVLENATVLIRGHQIRSVGRNVEIPRGARVFDLSGHTVIPGIVDAHAHPHLDHSALHVIEQRPPYFHGPLAYGVTTMVEVYGNEYRDGWLSDMLRAGKITGPRLYTTGSPIYGSRAGRPRMYRPFNTLAGAREQLRWNQDHGALAVKDYAQATRKRRHLTAMAARDLRLNVVSESSGNPQMNLTQVLDGVTGIEHSMALATFYDDVVRFWEASDAGMTPTLVVLYGAPYAEAWFHQQERLWEDEKLTRFILPEHLMRLRRTTHLWPEDFRAPTMAAAMRKLFENGTSIQLGAHGQMLGLDAHWELEMFVEGGFTPEQALEVATLRGAAHHGLDRSIGSLEPGKLADLVVLRDNPLDDIRNTRSVRYVMKHGVLYSGDDAARVYPNPQPAGEMYFRTRR